VSEFKREIRIHQAGQNDIAIKKKKWKEINYNSDIEIERTKGNSSIDFVTANKVAHWRVRELSSQTPGL